MQNFETAELYCVVFAFIGTRVRQQGGQWAVMAPGSLSDQVCHSGQWSVVSCSLRGQACTL